MSAVAVDLALVRQADATADRAFRLMSLTERKRTVVLMADAAAGDESALAELRRMNMAGMTTRGVRLPDDLWEALEGLGVALAQAKAEGVPFTEGPERSTRGRKTTPTTAALRVVIDRGLELVAAELKKAQVEEKRRRDEAEFNQRTPDMFPAERVEYPPDDDLRRMMKEYLEREGEDGKPLKQWKAAERLGTTQATWSRLQSGRMRFTPAWRASICRLLESAALLSN